MTPRSGNGFTLAGRQEHACPLWWQYRVLVKGVVPLVCGINAVLHWQAFCFTLDSRAVRGLLDGGQGVGRESLGERSAVWKMIASTQAAGGPRVTDQGGFNFP